MDDFRDEDLEELGEVEETEASYDVLATFKIHGDTIEGISFPMAHFEAGKDKEAVNYACSLTLEDLKKKCKLFPERATSVEFIVDEIVQISDDYSEDIGTIFKIDLVL